MKKEIRIIGFHEAAFDKYSATSQKTLLIGTIFRGGDLLEGVCSSQITIDGSDATSVMVSLVNSSKFKPQLKVILLSTSTYAGLNLVDLPLLCSETGIPVMAVIRTRPNPNRVRSVLLKVGMEEKIPLLDRAGPVYEDLGIYFQLAGLTSEKAIRILYLTMTQADYPEPLRVAKMIANGVARGAS